MKNIAFRFVIMALSVLLSCGSVVHAASPSSTATVPYEPIQTLPQDMVLVDVGTVKEIIKGDQIRLANNKIYHVDNIRVPIEYADILIEHMKKTYLDKKVGIYINPTIGEGRTDPSGNLKGHILTENGLWMQADIISHGLAWVTSSPTNRDLVHPLYEYEHIARKLRNGFWKNTKYAMRQADDINQMANFGELFNSFQVIEGTIAKVESELNFAYFYFNTDIKRGLRLRLDADAKRIFRTKDDIKKWAAYNPYSVTRAQIRVRGWVESEGGNPVIELTHPEQWQILAVHKNTGAIIPGLPVVAQ